MEWAVEKPGTDPTIYPSWEAATRALSVEVAELWKRYHGRGETSICERLLRIGDEVAGLPREGGGINMVVDQRTGLRYRATVRRRGIPEKVAS